MACLPASSRRARLALALALAVAAVGVGAASGLLSPFSTGKRGELPLGWLPWSVRDDVPNTRYELAEIEGRVVLSARAAASASALVHRLDADPRQTPRLTWRWRVDDLVAAADLSRRSGDDFPARVYVLFDLPAEALSMAERAKRSMAKLIYGEAPPYAALCYVWDNRHRVGSSVWSAYTERVRVIVVQSGAAKLGQWLDEERNLPADYRQAFGTEPPRIVGVVVAADTDNTGATTQAYFGDIQLHAAGGS